MGHDYKETLVVISFKISIFALVNTTKVTEKEKTD